MSDDLERDDDLALGSVFPVSPSDPPTSLSHHLTDLPRTTTRITDVMPFGL
jgi:hypothetical protein